MPVLTLTLARTVIDATLAAARRLGFMPMGVVVVDAAAQVLASAREDGASALRLDIALGKAGAAIGMGVNSRALIGGCGSRWLLNFCDQLADQHHRYRRLSAPRAFAKRGVKTEHQQLMEAAIDGRADDAVALLTAHFERTAKVIRDDPGLFAPRADAG